MLRRNFLQILGLGAAGMTGLSARAQLAKNTVTPRGSAENLIFVFLNGGQSHVDTFDLKTGSWTPDDFNPGTYGNLFLAAGLFPNLTQQTDKFSLLHAISGNEAVHQRASYILETAHTYNPTFAREQPHLGSLLAYELEAERASNDIFPTFLAMNARVQGPGMLPSTYAAFAFDAQSGVPGLAHPDGESVFRKRYESLMATDANRTMTASHGDNISDYHNFYALGEQLMYEPDVQETFTVDDNDLARYGNTGTGASCAMAVKALAANRGTRVIQITQGGWDSHYDIYDRTAGNNIYELSNELDSAVAAMLEDLAAKPGKRGGSLLDETMVVVTGEFGRTPGELTNNLGRDHFQYAWSALVAGGGIVPNQNFGATDATGSYITDPFWSKNRYIEMPDLIATMYSSLGVDWTKEILETPSGRAYEYTPKIDGETGYYTDITEMFG